MFFGIFENVFFNNFHSFLLDVWEGPRWVKRLTNFWLYLSRGNLKLGGMKENLWSEQKTNEKQAKTQTKRNQSKAKQSKTNNAMANNFHKTGFSGQLPSVAGSFYFRTRAENRKKQQKNRKKQMPNCTSCKLQIQKYLEVRSGRFWLCHSVSLSLSLSHCLFADVFRLIIYLVGALPLHVACQTRLFWYFRWPFNS